MLGLSDGPIRCGCLIQLVAASGADMAAALGTDVEALWFGSLKTKVWRTPFGLELIVPERFAVEDRSDGSSVVTNARGEVQFRRARDAYYFDPVAPALAGIASARELDRFDELFERWDFSPVYDEPLDALARRARAQYEATDRAVVTLWRMHYNQAGQLLRGFERFFVDLVENKDLVHAIMQKLHEVYLRRVDAFFDSFGDWFDVVFLTDDLGTQQSGLMSPAMYKEIIYPYMSDLVRRIKSRGKKVILHSCGCVFDFVPLMIEMGVDALNPVQVSARKMNPRDLVRQYGKDIAFWGGGCDTQHALNAPIRHWCGRTFAGDSTSSAPTRISSSPRSTTSSTTFRRKTSSPCATNSGSALAGRPSHEPVAATGSRRYTMKLTVVFEPILKPLGTGSFCGVFGAKCACPLLLLIIGIAMSTIGPALAAAEDLQERVEALVKEVVPAVVEWRRDLHAHPELSNREERTSRVVAEQLRAMGVDELKTGVAHHGVVALIRGNRPGPTVALRADMDALPIEEETGLPFASENPGVMHACGHDAHTAILLGTAKVLVQLRDRIPAP